MANTTSLWFSNSCVFSPKGELVVWSCCGTWSTEVPPEIQSQSRPDSAGGLFTQPQRSISKSQKPAGGKKTQTLQNIENTSQIQPLPLYGRGLGPLQEAVSTQNKTKQKRRQEGNPERRIISLFHFLALKFGVSCSH